MKNKNQTIIAICGYENIWIKYVEILEKNNINIPLIILNDFYNGEHFKYEDKEYLNLDLLNKGIVPNTYQTNGLGKECLSQIYNYQFYFDLMFDRMELNANKPKISSFEKNYIITNLMDYYIHKLKKKQFDFIFFSNIPHNIFDFSLYVACLITNTRTLLIRKEAFDTIYIKENFFKERSVHFENYLKNHYKNKVISYKKIESYINQLQNNDYKKIQPDYMKKQEKEKDKGSLTYFLQKSVKTSLPNFYNYFL